MLGRRVLVVEDDYFWADELCRGLHRAGVVVIGPAPSVAVALALIRSEPNIDAAILDIGLRGERAYAAADLLTARRVPFMILTGYDAAELPDDYAAAPRLEKPVTVEKALAELSDLLSPP